MHPPSTPRRTEFRANADRDARACRGTCERRRAEAALGGPQRARERHVARGKLLPRDRVMSLIDPGSPFLELSPLAANGMYDDAIHGAGLITGIGRVEGRECVIVCNDATIKGGTYYPDDGEEASARAGDRAREPAAVHLSGRFRRRQPAAPDRGVSRPRAFRPHLLQPGDAVVARHPADRRGDGLVHGRRRLCAGDVGRDHHRQRAGHHLPRRPAAGEGRDRRGGDAPRIWAAPTCTRASPASPITMAQDDHHALSHRAPHRRQSQHQEDRRHPAARAARAGATTPPSSTASCRPTCKKQYDVREVIARLVDGSEFDEFKALYGTTLVTGFAHIHGMPVGILANNGILFSESALKAAHFIELCCQRRIPLLFLQNIVGFMVGRDYEAGGIAKDGAKMVTAVACAQVPKITLIVGGSLRRRQLRHVRARLLARASCSPGRTRASR